MLAPETVLQNRYRILCLIGEGGMGAVYQALDLRFENIVALKESFFNDDRLRNAFEREARFLNHLHHPALPHVIDYFSEGEGRFLVMQFIPGDDLATVLEKRQDRVEPFGQPKPFDPDEVIGWGDQLLDALDYLHTRQPPIIHRDIKPQNLKLTERGQIILLDFGLAKGASSFTSQAASTRSIFAYTLHYAPLEQIQGTGTDPRSDLYSLAATLYHLMTGVAPADALSRATALLNGEDDPLISADRLNAGVPVETADVFMQAMELKRDERPDTAAEMRRLLNRRVPFKSGRTSIIERETDDLLRNPQTAKTHEEGFSTTPIENGSDCDEENIFDIELEPSVRTPARQGDFIIHAEQLHQQPGDSAIERRTKHRPALWILFIVLVVLAAGFIAARALWPGEDVVQAFEFEVVRVNAQGRPIEQRKARANYFTQDLGDGVTLDMVEIPAGSFFMGSPDAEKGRYDDEGPQRWVSVQSFFMGKFEVTQAQWRAVTSLPKVNRDLDPDPSHFKGDSLPVDSVSWEDAAEFCARLSVKTGREYRLPSEAEWEYACRAGTVTPFYLGETITADMVNYDGNKPYEFAPAGIYREKTTTAGQLNAPNAFGLYDMHGNVWEWCADPWHKDYEGAPPDGRVWQLGGDASRRVTRGGSWMNDGLNCRSATRLKAVWGPDQHNFGFRVACDPVKNP